jgi:hypothetical protein
MLGTTMICRILQAAVEGDSFAIDQHWVRRGTASSAVASRHAGAHSSLTIAQPGDTENGITGTRHRPVRAGPDNSAGFSCSSHLQHPSLEADAAQRLRAGGLELCTLLCIARCRNAACANVSMSVAKITLFRGSQQQPEADGSTYVRQRICLSLDHVAWFAISTVFESVDSRPTRRAAVRVRPSAPTAAFVL